MNNSPKYIDPSRLDPATLSQSTWSNHPCEKMFGTLYHHTWGRSLTFLEMSGTNCRNPMKLDQTIIVPNLKPMRCSHTKRIACKAHLITSLVLVPCAEKPILREAVETLHMRNQEEVKKPWWFEHRSNCRCLRYESQPRTSWKLETFQCFESLLAQC